MNGSRDKRRKADPLIKSETERLTGATHANAKNVVRECYEFASDGAQAADRHYLDWCEAKARLWISLAEEFGYTGWTSEIRTLTGQITYHEWLKKEVGL